VVAPGRGGAAPGGGDVAPSRGEPTPDDRRRRDVFARASTRLFLLFAAIVVVLLVVSGITTYAVFTTALHDVTRGHLSQAGEEELVTRTSARLRWQILAIDGVIVVAIGALGFWYARRTLRPIRDNFAAQKRFIADASHELRTPLAIMKTEFEVTLRHEPAESDAGRALESGLEEVDRMSDIVEDLLTLSRIDARQEQLHFAPVDVAALAQRCGEKLRPLAQRRDVGLTVRVAGPLTVSADVAHLERALLNVVRNAVEHSKAGDEVVLAAEKADGRVVVEVRDEGEGIAATDLPHIFDRFYRGDQARSGVSGGSGLGLAITRWIVEGHRGSTTASSTLGGGTTIRLTLPLAPTAHTAAT
jgi:two-component system sensor histidine kinase CiaH